MKYSFLIFLFVLFVGCSSDDNLNYFEDDNTDIDNPNNENPNDDLPDIITTQFGKGFYIHNPEVYYEDYQLSYSFKTTGVPYSTGPLILNEIKYKYIGFSGFKEALLTFKFRDSEREKDVDLELQFIDDGGVVRHTYPITLLKDEKEREFTLIVND